MVKKIKDLTGKKFGKLLVIKQSTERSSNNQICWEVICDCGVTKTVIGNCLKNGYTTSCGCYHKEMVSKANRKFDSNPALRKLIDSYRHGAENRDSKFGLSIEEADKLFSSNCFYCGIKPHRIYTEYKGKYSYVYNGIDRVDNNKTYTIDNVVSCCKDCNYAKHQMAKTEFLNWIERVYDHSIKLNKK